MKILVLSDIHGDIDNLNKLENEFKTADLVLFGGDFARFNELETGKPVLDALVKKHTSIYAVLGNCDSPEFLEELEKEDISVQGTLVSAHGLAIIGSGGALKFTGTTPNERSEEELLSDLRYIAEASFYTDNEELNTEELTESQETENASPVSWDNLIVISHQPPADTKCDTITSGIHVGSKELRTFVETYKPLLLLCGHIHESAGIDTIGDSLIINPGSLAEGSYGLVEVQKQKGIWKVVNAKLMNLS
ncbi:MAG: serine/threonine protein phosphatase [Spirochaetaceae bacterium]|nr:serine/threonine protein phosphatase [Spirochaetaceae bacterium]